MGARFVGCGPREDSSAAPRRPPIEGEIRDWIVIAPDNTVTIRVAQAEIGQGSMTAMVQLLAEELEVEWSAIRPEFISIRAQFERGGVYGRTAVAGSAGVFKSQQMLRTVGAQIRTMLVRAAAGRLGVPESDLVAEDGTVRHAASGTTLTYGELAAEAALVPIPDPASVRLKDPGEWKFIGQPVERVDAPAKVDGSAVYGIDVRLPGMKYAAIRMCPVPGGALRSYDADVALAHEGVLRVLALRGTRSAELQKQWRARKHGEPPSALRRSVSRVRGSLERTFGQPAIRGLDDAVVVVGESWWQASVALEAMPVEWDRGPWAETDSETILADLEEGLEARAVAIFRDESDPEAVRRAVQTVEADYFVPYLEHATMEPMNCTALVTDDTFAVWPPVQQPEGAMYTAAETAGMQVSQGELYLTQIGGGFGRRQADDFVAQAVAIARSMKGTPVQLIWSREETTRHGRYAPVSLSRLRARLDQDGRVVAWWHRKASPSESDVRTRFGADTLLYAIPSKRVDYVHTPNHMPEGQLRGVAYTPNTFISQSFIDEVARAAGRDPYQLQRELLDPARTPEAVPLEGPDIQYVPASTRAARQRRVLDEAARRAGWGTPLPQGRGRGIAVIEKAQAYYAVVVEVTLDGERWISVDRVVVAGDPGFLVNPDNATNQVEGSVAFALTMAMYGEITVRRGEVVQGNFDDYPLLRMSEMPPVETYWIPSGEVWGGVGEAVVGPVIPALTNAIYDAGGPRIRSLPIKNHEIVPREGALRG